MQDHEGGEIEKMRGITNTFSCFIGEGTLLKIFTNEPVPGN